MSQGHPPPVHYPELLALTGDRQRAARLEQVLGIQVQRMIEAARTGALDSLEQAERECLDRLGTDIYRCLRA